MDYTAYLRNEAGYYRYKRVRHTLTDAADYIERLEKMLVFARPDHVAQDDELRGELHKKYYPENY